MIQTMLELSLDIAAMTNMEEETLSSFCLYQQTQKRSTLLWLETRPRGNIIEGFFSSIKETFPHSTNQPSYSFQYPNNYIYIQLGLNQQKSNLFLQPNSLHCNVDHVESFQNKRTKQKSLKQLCIRTQVSIHTFNKYTVAIPEAITTCLGVIG